MNQQRLRPHKAIEGHSHANRPAKRAKVRRILFLRLAGLTLGSVAVGAALREQAAAAAWLWPLLAANAVLWPFLAYQWALRSRDPLRAERISLIGDSAMGGFWIAMMHFNPAPSLLLVLTLSMDKVAFGGWRFLAFTASAQLAACVVTAAATGFAVDLHASLPVMLACIPHLLVYPLLVASGAHGLLKLVERQREQLTAESRRDALTGLFNRTYWEDMTEHEFRRFKRSANSASIMLVDIDRFKNINDDLGHAAGDEVIKSVARVIGESIRSTDTAARFGGDEFVVLLSDTFQAGAVTLAEKIREQVASLRLPGATLQFSASIGVAAVDLGTADVASWFHRADLALYEAKRQGRNRVVMARDSAVVSG